MAWTMELTDLTQGQCHAVFKVEEISLDAPQLIIYPDDLKALALDFKGKSMDCTMPLEGDANISLDESMGFCEGELKQALEETGQAFSDYQQRLYLTNVDCIPGTLWDANNTHYEIFGIVDVNGEDYCKTEYSFGIPNRLSEITVTHFAGFTDEFLELDFPKNVQPLQEYFNEWCESSDRWTETGLGGTVKVLSVESMLYEDIPTCRFNVLIQPVSEILPASTVDVYALQDGRTAILAQTNNFNTFQFTFSPGQPAE
jgi:hypothetical protein